MILDVQRYHSRIGHYIEESKRSALFVVVRGGLHTRVGHLV